MQKHAAIVGAVLAVLVLIAGIFWFAIGRSNAASAESEVDFSVDPTFAVPGGADNSGAETGAQMAPTSQPEIPGIGPGTSGGQ